MATDVAIREAALHLFSTVGFNGTGIRLIAQEAGISLASLYHYMSSKEDLLVAIMRSNIEGLLREADRACAGVTDARGRIEALVAAHITIHATRSEECVVSDTELRALSAPMRDDIVVERDRYERKWREAIEQGIADGSFAHVDVAIASKALLQMCTGVAHWFDPGGRLDIAGLKDRYAEMALGLLGARVGDESV